MREKEPDAKLPQLAMTLYNDYVYLARQCIVITMDVPHWPKEYTFLDLAPAFMHDASSLFENQMVKLQFDIYN